MRLVVAQDAQGQSEIETIFVSAEQFEFLKRFAASLNPDMPMEFGGAQAIRTLLERFEDADIDLADAKCEEDISRSAAEKLRLRSCTRRRVSGA